jgi:hypothetical protein
MNFPRDASNLVDLRYLNQEINTRPAGRDSARAQENARLASCGLDSIGVYSLMEDFAISERPVAVFSPIENLTDPRIERIRCHELFDRLVSRCASRLPGATPGPTSNVLVERVRTGCTRFRGGLVAALPRIRLAARLPGSIRRGRWLESDSCSP